MRCPDTARSRPELTSPFRPSRALSSIPLLADPPDDDDADT